MAYLLKQQPLQNSSVQQVSIIAQCSGAMFHLLSDKLMQIATSRALSELLWSRRIRKCCSETQLSHEELAGIRAESAGGFCPMFHEIQCNDLFVNPQQQTGCLFDPDKLFS